MNKREQYSNDIISAVKRAVEKCSVDRNCKVTAMQATEKTSSGSTVTQYDFCFEYDQHKRIGVNVSNTVWADDLHNIVGIREHYRVDIFCSGRDYVNAAVNICNKNDAELLGAARDLVAYLESVYPALEVRSREDDPLPEEAKENAKRLANINYIVDTISTL